jgi:hypothetical protein
MKAKILLLFVSLAMPWIVVHARNEQQMIAISADANETNYLLAAVERVDVVLTNKDASLSVVGKDGFTQLQVQKLLFPKENVSAIGQVGEMAVFVYPNPVEHTLQIAGAEAETQLQVYNLAGELIVQCQGEQVEVTSLEKGTYILRVNNQYVKFIKK